MKYFKITDILDKCKYFYTTMYKKARMGLNVSSNLFSEALLHISSKSIKSDFGGTLWPRDEQVWYLITDGHLCMW